MEYSVRVTVSLYRVLWRPVVHEEQEALRISQISFSLQYGSSCAFWVDVLRGKINQYS